MTAPIFSLMTSRLLGILARVNDPGPIKARRGFCFVKPNACPHAFHMATGIPDELAEICILSEP
jgi:hypothetical protein